MKVLHVIARVNLGGTARWLETLTAEQTAAGQEVVVATGHVQGDEVEDPGADTMPLVRLDRLGRAVSPFDDVRALRELRDLIGRRGLADRVNIEVDGGLMQMMIRLLPRPGVKQAD